MAAHAVGLQHGTLSSTGRLVLVSPRGWSSAHQDIKDGIMTPKTFHEASICSMMAC